MNNEQENSKRGIQEGEQIQGRSIFIIETIASGVKVQTAFLAEDGRVIPMPGIFPTQEYALGQVDELRKAIIHHFEQAAKVGAQVISRVNQSNQSLFNPDLSGPNPEDTIQ